MTINNPILAPLHPALKAKQDELFSDPPIRKKRDKSPFCWMCQSSFKRRFLPKTKRKHWTCINPDCYNYYKTAFNTKDLKKEISRYEGWRRWFRIQHWLRIRH